MAAQAGIAAVIAATPKPSAATEARTQGSEGENRDGERGLREDEVVLQTATRALSGGADAAEEAFHVLIAKQKRGTHQARKGG